MTRRLTRAARCRGLTFVELLIAATIIAILMAGLVLHLRGGMTAWRRTVEVGERMQRVRAVWDALARDVSAAVVVDARPASAWGVVADATHLSLCTGSTGPGGAMRKVTYAVTDAGDGRALVRSEQSLREAAAGILGDPRVVLADVEAVNLRYAVMPDGETELQWQEAWTDPASLPQVIEVTLELSASAGGGEISQVLLVPGGTLMPAEGS